MATQGVRSMLVVSSLHLVVVLLFFFASSEEIVSHFDLDVGFEACEDFEDTLLLFGLD
jgi:hypothetical protein